MVQESKPTDENDVEVPVRNFIFKNIEDIDHVVAPFLTGKALLATTALLWWMLDSVLSAAFIAVLLRYFYTKLTSDVRYISCKDDMPLVKKNTKHLGDKELAQVRKVVKLGHPLLEDSSHQALNAEMFSSTQGFVVRFNLAGLKQFQSDENFAFMQPYFNSIRTRRANAFVANLLICNASEGDGLAVGLHVDTSVAIKSHKTFMAHQVDVWYVQVPSGMRGGDLEIFSYSHPQWGHGVTPPQQRPPDQVVKPEENVHVSFRGDAHHQVRAFACPGAATTPRVSLVVEQYIIDSDYYWLTKEFEISKKGMQMM